VLKIAQKISEEGLSSGGGCEGGGTEVDGGVGGGVRRRSVALVRFLDGHYFSLVAQSSLSVAGIYLYVCISINMYVYTCVHMYVYMYVYVYLCIFIYSYMYI